MDLSALADFHLVVAHGSLGLASRSSGRPKATLSRRIMALEHSLGVRLLERGARSLRLTEEGRALYERTHEPLADIAEAAQSVTARLAPPRGRLRVSAPVLFSHTLLGELAARFARLYPQVLLEITAEERTVDLVAEGYDVAVRVNPQPDALLVGRCFARDEMLLVAPSSLARPSADGQPVPAVVLARNASPALWRYEDGPVLRSIAPQERLRLSSLIMVRDAVLAGTGAAVLPRLLLAHSGAVPDGLAVWGRLADRPVEMWALHASRRLVSARVAAFVQFLCDAFAERELAQGVPERTSGAPT